MITYQQVKDILSEYPKWSIFPVCLSQGENRIDKKPAVAWKEFMERQATDDELHKWFDEPKYNAIGLVTGKISGVVVVDVDSPEIPDEIILNSPLVADTISGGHHFYYRWDEELRNDAKIEGLPIDFRGDGGFVVIPPSAFGDKEYSWQTSLCPEFLLDVIPIEIKELLKGRKGNFPNAIPNVEEELNGPRKIEYGEDLEEFMTPAQKGERNVRASEMAGKICRSLSPHQWDDFGWGRLRDWNNALTSPLKENELKTVWKSITHKNLLQREQEGNKQITVTKEENQYKDIESNLSLCTIFSGNEATEEFARLEFKYGDGLVTGYDELDYYFKFLPEQLYLISAQTHVGKSTFALNICARVASLGHNVLFCSLEQGIFIEPRVKSMIGGDFPEKLSILTSDKMLSVEQLCQVIEKTSNKPELICIDHIHFLKKSGKGSTEDIDEIILKLQNMAKTLEVPVMVISHVRKLNNDKAPELDDLKDSSSLSQVPSVVIVLYRKKNENKSAFDSILSTNGQVIIAKNRIQGRTGMRYFDLLPSGEIRIKDKENSLNSRTTDELGEDEIKNIFH
jgi:hypothetical protein